MRSKHPKPIPNQHPATLPRTAANAALAQFSNRIEAVAGRMDALRESGMANARELRELERLLEATHKKFVQAAAAASQHRMQAAR